MGQGRDQNMQNDRGEIEKEKVGRESGREGSRERGRRERRRE